MTRALHVTVDPAAISPSRSIAAAARMPPLLVLTHRALADLERELGGFEAAAQHLHRVATNTGKPLGVHVPTDTGSRRMFISPKGWTRERLAGWIGGHHQLLERQFGTATFAPLEDL